MRTFTKVRLRDRHLVSTVRVREKVGGMYYACDSPHKDISTMVCVCVCIYHDEEGVWDLINLSQGKQNRNGNRTFDPQHSQSPMITLSLRLKRSCATIQTGTVKLVPNRVRQILHA